MINTQIESVLIELVPESVHLTQPTGASKLQAIRESCAVRASMNVKMKTIAMINKRLKQILLTGSQPELPQNQPSVQVSQTAQILLNQHPGICHGLNSFVTEHQLTLHDLLDIDFTTLISEGVDLDAFCIVLQAMGILPHMYTNILVSRYVLFYGGYHIMSRERIVVKVPSQTLQQKPKPSTEFLVVCNKLFHRTIYRGSFIPYVIESIHAVIASPNQEIVDFGIVTSTSTTNLVVSTQYYTNVEVQGTQALPLHTGVRLDTLNMKLQTCPSHYFPLAETICSLEIFNQIRRAVTFDGEQKTVEFLIAIPFEADDRIRVQLALARQTSGFAKALVLAGEEQRLFYQLDNRSGQKFTDEREGLPFTQIYLPFIFDGCIRDKFLYGLKLSRMNLLQSEFKPPLNVKQCSDQGDFYKQAKISLKLSSSAVQGPLLVQEDVKPIEGPVDSNCYVLLSQSAQHQWIAGKPHTEILFASLPLELNVKITENKTFQIDVTQIPETQGAILLESHYEHRADEDGLFSSVLLAFQQQKLKVMVPRDYFIDAFVNYLSQKQGDHVQVPVIAPGQEFRLQVFRALLLTTRQFVLVPTQVIMAEMLAPADLPVFLPIADSLFEQNIRSAAAQGLEQDVHSLSGRVSQHNSLHSFEFRPVLMPDNMFSFPMPEEQPLGLPMSQPLDNLFCLPLPVTDNGPRLFESAIKESPPKNNFVQLSTNSITMGSHISSLQEHCNVDLDCFLLKNITGYVRYHLPAYNVAIIAFTDPLSRSDSWGHSLAVWNLPEEFRHIRLKRDNKGKTVQICQSKGESIYIARAQVKCTVKPMEANSGVYVVQQATLVNYLDPCEQFTVKAIDKNATVEGSVYWQEIQQGKKNATSYGFVRLASGHERHFYLKEQKPVLGHLVKLKLFNNETNFHPNSCELVQSLLPPPDRHKWLFGRVVGVYQNVGQETEAILKQSYRTSVNGSQSASSRIVNGMILTEPMQGTHVDLCFFRLVLPESVIEQLKVGMGIHFTLKELALHKVVDQTDSVYQTPVDLVNQILLGKRPSAAYAQNEQDIGNSRKLSCWAVDNICLDDFYVGYFKSIPARKCSGLQAEQSFFEQYGRVLLNGFESLVYVPRPTLNISPPIFKEQERFVFSVHLVYQEAKAGYVPEANQIKKVTSDVSSRRIRGTVLKLAQDKRCPLYIFRPDRENDPKDEVGRVLECLQESLAPESHCYVINPTAFYRLSNELLRVAGPDKMRSLFSALTGGKLTVCLKSVSIGLISDGEFERHPVIAQTINLLQQNIYSSKDENGNRHNLFWCRYADELFMGEEPGLQEQNEAKEPCQGDDEEGAGFLGY